VWGLVLFTETSHRDMTKRGRAYRQRSLQGMKGTCDKETVPGPVELELSVEAALGILDAVAFIQNNVLPAHSRQLPLVLFAHEHLIRRNDHSRHTRARTRSRPLRSAPLVQTLMWDLKTSSRVSGLPA